MEIRNFSDIKSFFLDNKSIKQTIFKNTFWLSIAEGISKVMKLILLIYVARVLGATEYGKFSFALAFVGLFTVFISMGLPRIVVRELSQDKEKEKEFSSILSLRVFLSLVALILILIGSFFVTVDPLIRKIILVLAFFTVFDSFAGFLNLFFQAKQKMEHESWTKIIRALTIASLGMIVILKIPSVENLSYAYLFASLISLIFILLFFHFKINRLFFSWNISVWKKYFKMSWPLALAGFFSIIYGQIDSVMMGYLNQITETGWYNAAYRIAGGIIIPFGLFSTSFYPALSRSFKESKEKLQKIWNYEAELMILFSLPIMAGGIILSPKIIDFIYGRDYTFSILAFKILIIMTGISLLQNPLSHILLIFNQQKKFVFLGIAGAVINIVLNIFLIPRYSLYGAASAAALTAFFVLIAYLIFSLRFTSIKIINFKLLWTWVLAIISTSIMCFIVSNPVIYNFHIVFSVAIGMMIYFSAFSVLRIILKNIKIKEIPL